MSAHDQIRKMLDELMGTGRDGEVRRDQIHFSDVRVCRGFLVACCPHEVLANTRMDMGDCAKHHDPALRADFEKAQKDKDYYYDIDAIETLKRFFDDVDRKMELSRKRLEETQEETDAEVSEKANKVLELNEDIGKNLAEAERLGELGQVDESLKLMEKVEELRKAKRDAEAKEQERREQRDRTGNAASSRGFAGGGRFNDRGGSSRGYGYDRDRRRRSRSRSRDRNGGRSSKHSRSKSPGRHRRSRSRDSGGGAHRQRDREHKQEKKHKGRSGSPRGQYATKVGSRSRSPGEAD